MREDDQVARGIEWLNDIRPGWRNLLTAPVRMRSIFGCVLGQVGPDYFTLARTLPGANGTYSSAVAEAFGFYSADDDYAPLNEAWRRAMPGFEFLDRDDDDEYDD